MTLLDAEFLGQRGTRVTGRHGRDQPCGYLTYAFPDLTVANGAQMAVLDDRTTADHHLRDRGLLHRVNDVPLEVAGRLERQIVNVEGDQVGERSRLEGANRKAKEVASASRPQPECRVRI